MSVHLETARRNRQAAATARRRRQAEKISCDNMRLLERIDRIINAKDSSAYGKAYTDYGWRTGKYARLRSDKTKYADVRNARNAAEPRNRLSTDSQEASDSVSDVFESVASKGTEKIKSAMVLPKKKVRPESISEAIISQRQTSEDLEALLVEIDRLETDDLPPPSPVVSEFDDELFDPYLESSVIFSLTRSKTTVENVLLGLALRSHENRMELKEIFEKLYRLPLEDFMLHSIDGSFHPFLRSALLDRDLEHAQFLSYALEDCENNVQKVVACIAFRNPEQLNLLQDALLSQYGISLEDTLKRLPQPNLSSFLIELLKKPPTAERSSLVQHVKTTSTLVQHNNLSTRVRVNPRNAAQMVDEDLVVTALTTAISIAWSPEVYLCDRLTADPSCDSDTVWDVLMNYSEAPKALELLRRRIGKDPFELLSSTNRSLNYLCSQLVLLKLESSRKDEFKKWWMTSFYHHHNREGDSWAPQRSQIFSTRTISVSSFEKTRTPSYREQVLPLIGSSARQSATDLSYDVCNLVTAFRNDRVSLFRHLFDTVLVVGANERCQLLAQLKRSTDWTDFCATLRPQEFQTVSTLFSSLPTVFATTAVSECLGAFFSNISCLLVLCLALGDKDVSGAVAEFRKAYGIELESAAGEIGGPEASLIIKSAVSRSDKSNDPAEAWSEASRLFVLQNSQERQRLNRSLLLEIFSKRSSAHISRVIMEYEKAMPHTIDEAISVTFEGEIQDLVAAFVRRIRNEVHFFSHEIRRLLLAGQLNTLLALLLLRSEIDLKTINQQLRSDAKLEETESEGGFDVRAVLVRKLTRNDTRDTPARRRLLLQPKVLS